MKNIFRGFFPFGLIIGAVSFWAACNKTDSEVAYGISKIYMPQAVNVSAGINNNYLVPTGTDSATYNYKIDTVNKKLNIILGVSLSGKAQSTGYMVNVTTNTDTVNQMIANGIFDASTVLMPTSLYTLPTQVAVASGKDAGTFYLSLDINQLKTTYAAKKLALAVTLSNPTNYSLDQALATTIVIVDVSLLNL